VYRAQRRGRQVLQPVRQSGVECGRSLRFGPVGIRSYSKAVTDAETEVVKIGRCVGEDTCVSGGRQVKFSKRCCGWQQVSRILKREHTVEAAQPIIAFLFGFIFVVAMIVLSVKFPQPTPFQERVFQTVLALAAAGVAAMIPGLINLELDATSKLLIRAGGAIAVFVIVYFLNPAKSQTHAAASHSKEATGSSTPDFVPPALKPVWHLLDTSLQDAFSMAANEARRQGKDIISTKTLFAVLVRLQPQPLAELIARLPAGSLPDPIAAGTPHDPTELGNIHQLSACVQDSLTNLAPQASESAKLTEVDVFIDIARHGRGESVQRLRTHGVDPNRIDEIVKQLGWVVKRRD
jgi:hypothetical protein